MSIANIQDRIAIVDGERLRWRWRAHVARLGWLEWILGRRGGRCLSTQRAAHGRLGFAWHSLLGRERLD
jgi:hypothetical protein